MSKVHDWAHMIFQTSFTDKVHQSAWELCAKQVILTPKLKGFQIPLHVCFALTCNTDVMFSNQSEQLKAGPGCNF